MKLLRRHDPPDSELVGDISVLTLKARRAAIVGSGLRPGQAAEKLGTIEKAAWILLKRVFAKVGGSRQSELAALLTRPVLQ